MPSYASRLRSRSIRLRALACVKMPGQDVPVSWRFILKVSDVAPVFSRSTSDNSLRDVSDASSTPTSALASSSSLALSSRPTAHATVNWCALTLMHAVVCFIAYFLMVMLALVVKSFNKCYSGISCFLCVY